MRVLRYASPQQELSNKAASFVSARATQPNITIDAESFADQVNSAGKLLVDNKNTYTSLVTIKTCQVRQA